jgi:uncharacterized protein (UPF0332 family)
MTDLNSLYEYRIEQARKTLSEAEKMLNGGFSARSIINRAYYAMFYSVLALFLRTGINISTSKHSGMISLFDKEFVLNGRFDRSYSRQLHVMFDKRLEFDYKEYVEPSMDEAIDGVENARHFISAIEEFIRKNLTDPV